MKITPPDNFSPTVTRRKFLMLCVAGAGAVACQRQKSLSSGPLSLGPVEKFGEGATPLDIYRVQIMRKGGSLRAVSLMCTHQTCLLAPQPNGFSCPCHGSEFDVNGAKLSGPAPRSLPWYVLSLSPERELLLHRDQEVDSNWKLET